MLSKQDKHKQILAKKLSDCEKVSKTLQTEGWKDVIEPLLNAMIEDCTGRKKGSRWIKGTVHSDPNIVHYQHALITFYNKLADYIDAVDMIREELVSLNKPKMLVTPIQRSKYATKGKVK